MKVKSEKISHAFPHNICLWGNLFLIKALIQTVTILSSITSDSRKHLGKKQNMTN